MSQRRGDMPASNLTVRSAASAAVKLAAMAAGFGVFVLLGRAGGPEAAGHYAIGLSLLQVLVLVIGLGFPGYVMREVARAVADPARAATADTVVRRSTLIVVCASAAAAVVLFGSAQWLAVAIFDKPPLVPVLKFVALAVVPYALMVMLAEAARGAGWGVSALAVHSLAVPAAVLAWLAGSRLVTYGSIEAASAAAALSAGSAGAAAIAWMLWRRTGRGVTGSAAAPETRGRWHQRTAALLRAGMPFLVASLASTALYMVDILMLGTLGTAADTGRYTAASRLAGVVGVALFAVNNVLTPRIASDLAAGRRGDFAAHVRTAMALAFWPSIMISAGLLVFATGALGLFGDGFEAGAPALRILLAGAIVHAATGPVANVLIAAGLESVLQRILIVALLADIVLNAVLIPIYGAAGAALATALSVAGWNGAAVIVVMRRLGLCMIYGLWRGGSSTAGAAG